MNKVFREDPKNIMMLYSICFTDSKRLLLAAGEAKGANCKICIPMRSL